MQVRLAILGVHLYRHSREDRADDRAKDARNENGFWRTIRAGYRRDFRRRQKKNQNDFPQWFVFRPGDMEGWLKSVLAPLPLPTLAAVNTPLPHSVAGPIARKSADWSWLVWVAIRVVIAVVVALAVMPSAGSIGRPATTR